jgi:hypothetical protein
LVLVGRRGEVVQLRNRQIIDTLDDDDVRDIKYKKKPEIYSNGKLKKKKIQTVNLGIYTI